MADRGSDHWWNRGPLAQMRANHPWIAAGAQYGGAYGAAAGAVIEGIGKLGEWGRDRGYWGGTNMDPNATSMGPPSDMAGPGGPPEGYQPDYNMGPPSNLAGPDPNSGPAWFNDTTMNPDDPMGLVPDYGMDGMPVGPNGIPLSPEGRRTYQGAYGNTRSSIFDSQGPRSDFQGTVTNMLANGSNVILGNGDPNGRYRNRGTDFGG